MPHFGCFTLPDGPSKPLGATVLDGYKLRELLAIAGTFFLSLIILCAVGGAGPAIFASTTQQISVPCAASAPCGAVPMLLALNAADQWNQAVGVLLRFRRPNTATGPAGLGQPVTFNAIWNVQAVTLNGQAVPGVANTTHTAQVFFGPADVDSSPVFLFGAVLFGPSSYAMELTLQDPLLAFRGYAQLKDGAVLTVTQNNVNSAYTQFEASNKVFFCVVSIVLFAFFVFTLARRDTSKALTNEQVWAAVLGGTLFWYNDPLFLTYLASPTMASAGFTAFCTATFVALLLFFVLCLADNARLEGNAGGAAWRSGSAARTQGALYWIPKVVVCAVLWALGLSLYMFQRLSQLSDPTFSFSDVFGAQIVLWVGRFIVGVGVVYVLYLFVLLVCAFRVFRALSPSSKYILALSVTALVVTLVGLFSQTFSSTRSSAILFLVSYGGPTMYMWNLMLVLRPGPAPAEWDADTVGAMGGSDHARDVGVVIREAEEDAGEGAVGEEVRPARGLRWVSLFFFLFARAPL